MSLAIVNAHSCMHLYTFPIEDRGILYSIEAYSEMCAFPTVRDSQVLAQLF